MELYKFEQDIKNKLEKRTLKPTANSWGKLENSLQSTENRKNKKFLMLMSVAASIVGVLFIVSMFFEKVDEEITPTIVVVPLPQKEDSSFMIEEEKLVADEANFDKLKVDNSQQSTPEKVTIEPVYKSVNHDELIVTNVEMSIEKNEKISARVNVESKLKKSLNIEIDNQEIELVINQIEELKEKHFSVSTSDVDLLLKNAQQELALQRIYNENIKTVDAYKLLQDVEADLDKSMRVKFLETLKMNYESMKTVIAQRND